MKSVVMTVGLCLMGHLLFSSPSSLASSAGSGSGDTASATQSAALLPISIDQAKARPSVGPNGAVFMTFYNFQPVEDRLVSVKCTLCDVVEIHDHVQEGPVENPHWKMRPIPFLTLPLAVHSTPSPVILASGGKHIMLLGLKRPLQKGESFPITLYFQKAPPQDITVLVTDEVPVAEHAHAHP